MPCLLDTSIIVDYLRDNDEAVTFMEALPGRPAASVCTALELMSGAKSSKEEARIERLNRIMQVLPVTEEIAWTAGRHIKHFQKSHGLDDLDAIIAATAEHHGLQLATMNVKHFPMFARMKPAY